MGYILIPVYSNNERIDLITGLVANYGFHHLAKKNRQHVKSQKIGEAVSEYTGEVFRVQEVSIQEKIQRIGTFHVNLFGNKGSHYIGTFTYDHRGELTYLKVSVPESTGVPE
jgi:hypothetical protein